MSRWHSPNRRRSLGVLMQLVHAGASHRAGARAGVAASPASLAGSLGPAVMESLLQHEGGPVWLAGFVHGASGGQIMDMVALKSDAELAELQAHGFHRLGQWRHDPQVGAGLALANDSRL